MDAEGLPTSKLTGDSLMACEKIGSTATTIEEAKEDPKVRLNRTLTPFHLAGNSFLRTFSLEFVQGDFEALQGLTGVGDDPINGADAALGGSILLIGNAGW